MFEEEPQTIKDTKFETWKHWVRFLNFVKEEPDHASFERCFEVGMDEAVFQAMIEATERLLAVECQDRGTQTQDLSHGYVETGDELGVFSVEVGKKSYIWRVEDNAVSD